MLLLIYEKTLFIALFSFSINAFSEWEYITTSKTSVVYKVNLDNIRESDGYTFFWQLRNFIYPQESLSGIYRSVLEYKQADCKMFGVKDLQVTTHSKINAGGNLVYSVDEEDDDRFGKWLYPPPSSIQDTILKRVCE